MKNGKRHLPLWSKALISLVFVGVGSFLYLSTQIILEFRTIILRSENKAYMQVCAQKMAPFPQPLPAGYEYAYDLDFEWFNVVLLVINHIPDNQKIYFVSHSHDTSDAIGTKELLDRVYDIGITTETANCRFTDVKTKGDISIGSDKLLYMTGVLKDQQGRIYEGVVGCVRNLEKKKTMLAWSLGPAGKVLNLDNYFNLLKSLPSL